MGVHPAWGFSTGKPIGKAPWGVTFPGAPPVFRGVSDSTKPTVKVRLRITRGEEDAFGPGKAQLLELLLETESLNRAASALKMSYIKALALVRSMNEHFREPLVEQVRGGKKGGGTKVTDAGKKVLADYQEMRAACEAAALPGWRRLKRRVKE